MNKTNLWRGAAALLLAVWQAHTMAPSAVGQIAGEGEILTQGPIHEAYASETAEARIQSEVIRSRPPDPIEELPPDQRPDGDNVTWIPGYWMWDDVRTDYIWISGVWRDIPPDRQWIPGYWTDASGGYVFVSGYWEDLGRSEVDYLPGPPEPLELGPSSPAPFSNATWSPGSWVWVETRYAWQPGYWVAAQPGWIWTPSYYVWTPRGYVFVAGYWDYELAYRGLCFAPVYYPRHRYLRAGFHYSPSIVIDINIAIGHFFVRPRSCHYYFGDYYADQYYRHGYKPWYSYHRDRDHYRHYDPIFAHYREDQLRRDRDWDRRVDDDYRHRRNNPDARPPRTYAALQDVERRAPRTDERSRRDLVVAQPLTEIAKREERPRPIREVNMDTRRELQTRNRAVDDFRAERERQEATAPSSWRGQRRESTEARERPAREERTPAPPVERSRQPDARDDRERVPAPQPSPIPPTEKRDTPPKQTSPNERRAEPDTRPTERQPRPSREETQREIQTRQPERWSMPQSPVAAKRGPAVRQAPQRPEIPRADVSRSRDGVQERSGPQRGQDQNRSGERGRPDRRPKG